LKTKGGNTTIHGESMTTSVIHEGNDYNERHEEENLKHLRVEGSASGMSN
jgi:hypothetical protein